MCSGRASRPLLAASRSSTSSTPDDPNRSDRSPTTRSPSLCRTSMRSTAWGMARCVSSSVTCSWQQRGRLGAGLRQLPGRLAEPVAQLAASAAELVDALVGGVELEQPGGGLGGPGDDLVDGLAVLAGERGERRAALGDHGEPLRVGVDAAGVGRDVGGEVGEQVGELGQPVAQLAGLGVVLPDAVEEPAGRGDRSQGVGGALLAREGLAGLLGGGAQGVGVAEPRLLRGQLDVLAGLGGDVLDLAEAEAEQVGLAGPLAGVPDHLGELALDVDELPVEVGVGGEQRGDGRPREPVECVALGARPQQPVLVGLAVHGDQRLGDLREPRDGHRRAADEGARTALRGDVARQHDPVVLDHSPGTPRRPRRGRAGRARVTTPSTRACFAPVRTAPVSARPPSSSPSAVTTMVLPAPVSPVITVSPGPSSRTEESITPSWPMRISSIMRRPPRASRRTDGGARPLRASPRRAVRTSRPTDR